MSYVDARCPLRPGEMCSLCVPGATGPQDCPTVAEVMRDPALRERLFPRTLDRASAVPCIEEIRITAKLDQLLEPLPEGDSYLGFIFARAGTADEVVAALRTAHATLTFQIDPELRELVEDVIDRDRRH